MDVFFKKKIKTRENGDVPPKKRIKSIKQSDVKIQKSNYGSLSNTVPKTENCITRLSTLPVDVLLYIYQYLSPVDLFALTQLGDQTLSDLTLSSRKANFSSCQKASFEVISSYFSRERVKYIQDLNFNYIIFARAHDLVQIICRCKNLIVLSVVGCGIKYSQILKILENCSILQEIYWDVKEIISQENFTHPTVTRLHLFCANHHNIFNSFYTIARNFPRIENIFVYLSSDNLLILPFIGSWLKSLSISNNDYSRWCTFITNSFQDFTVHEDELFLLNTVLGKISDNLSSQSSDTKQVMPSVYYNNPPCLKIQSIGPTVSTLSSISKSYSNLSIILTEDNVAEYENLLKCLSEIAGHRLKYLSLDWKPNQHLANGNPMPPSVAQCFTICDILNTLFFSCQNVTVLNIGTVHFTAVSPSKALCNLKSLRILNMPTCALSVCKCIMDDPKLKCSKCCTFLNVVSSCSKVEDFHLICCKDDIGRVNDADMDPIKYWKKLKKLSLYSVIFRTCRFLRRVASCCDLLQSFSFITSVPNVGCIFYDDITYLLLNADNLSFLRINERNFNPMFGRFMDALGKAENLEGICLVTACQSFIPSSIFENQMEWLKYLHLFHLQAPKVPECLYTKIRKSMEKNGIKNCKIEKKCCSKEFYDVSKREYYHQEPQFCCEHLHLKDICI